MGASEVTDEEDATEDEYVTEAEAAAPPNIAWFPEMGTATAAGPGDVGGAAGAGGSAAGAGGSADGAGGVEGAGGVFDLVLAAYSLSALPKHATAAALDSLWQASGLRCGGEALGRERAGGPTVNGLCVVGKR